MSGRQPQYDSFYVRGTMVIPASNTSVRISGPYWDPRDRAGSPWCVTVKHGSFVKTEHFPYRDDAVRYLAKARAQAFQDAFLASRRA